ncbi:MAG: fibronectin type III domain-containing protein, partial [Elusimicrobia bacterium]|nr:fibronectin type III domain-containing protein [Elusimicrobiota bacterium]
MSLIVFLFQPPILFCWTYLDGGDHAGEDWTFTEDSEVCGNHWNVKQFQIKEGVTVKVKPYDGMEYGAFEVHASTLSVNGTLQADGSGFGGGASNQRLANGTLSGGPGRGDGGGKQGVTLTGGGGGGGVGDGGAGGDTSYSRGGAGGSGSEDALLGSGGGSGGEGRTLNLFSNQYSEHTGGSGGRGGGTIVLAGEFIFIVGEVNSNGSQGLDGQGNSSAVGSGGGGGGSGGTITLSGDKIHILGAIHSKGGQGGNAGYRLGAGGGGGSGGKINILYGEKFQNDDALVSVLGGKGGRLSIAGGAGHDGNSGAVHYNQRPSVPILLSPLTQSTTVQPLFRWQESQDTEGTTSFTYQLQVSSETSFPSLMLSTARTQSFYKSTATLPGKLYWRVRAFDGEIYSHWSDPWIVVGDTVAPVGGFIDSVSAEITSCTVNLQNAADPNGEIHFQPFLIEVSSSAGFAGKTDSSGWQKDRVWKVIGLSANTTYYFRSKTRDSVLNESDWSPTRLQVTEVSPVPDITVSRVGVSSCTLKWGKSFSENPPQTIYEIQFSSAGFQMENLIVSTHATAGSGWIALEGLLPNRNYHGRLVAKNWQGSASVSATFSTVTLARPPASVQVSLLGSTSIQMTQGDSDNPDGTAYLSQVSTSSDFSFIYSSSLTQNISLVHDSLQPNSPYFLRVSARNQSGRDHFSQIWSFQTLPSLPSLLRFSSVTAESLEVQWEENKNPP